MTVISVHRQWVTTTFLTKKKSQIVLVLLTGFELQATDFTESQVWGSTKWATLSVAASRSDMLQILILRTIHSIHCPSLKKKCQWTDSNLQHMLTKYNSGSVWNPLATPHVYLHTRPGGLQRIHPGVGYLSSHHVHVHVHRRVAIPIVALLPAGKSITLHV